MTTSTFALTQAGPVQLYFHNLGRAARLFGAALLAAAPQLPEVQAPASRASAKFLRSDSDSRAAATEMLHSLASRFDATQPNQAAELRWLAARG